MVWYGMVAIATVIICMVTMAMVTMATVVTDISRSSEVIVSDKSVLDGERTKFVLSERLRRERSITVTNFKSIGRIVWKISG